VTLQASMTMSWKNGFEVSKILINRFRHAIVVCVNEDYSNWLHVQSRLFIQYDWIFELGKYEERSFSNID
jgi:hypothetical protein